MLGTASTASDYRRPQDTLRMAINGNGTGGPEQGQRQAHAPEHDKEKACFQVPWRGVPGTPENGRLRPALGPSFRDCLLKTLLTE
jgi:hypothetical protein